MSALSKNINKLHEIIVALRQPDGCPWDQKQTPESFKTYMIEEAHELLEAVEDGAPEQIKEELGDMFFQLTFLGNLYEEKGLFTLADAINSITEKMINRHPHVFGEEKVQSAEEQRRRWNELKSKEKKKKKRISDLVSGVPKSMPALRRAQRVSERAAHNGFEWQNIDSVFEKIDEEIVELKQAFANNDKRAIREELGDLLFTLVNFGRVTDTNAEESLISATEKFIIRFEEVEKALKIQGKKIAESSPSELQELWKEIKKVS